MPTYNLSKEFIDHFEISNFFQNEIKGGQKTVYFPEIKGTKYAMKIHNVTGVDPRLARELNIYDKYKDIKGIPSIFSTESYEGDLVIFEEFIEGNVLSSIQNSYLKDTDKVINLIKALSDILKPIWNDDLVHRDIKPQNIIIKNDGTPVILDFGIARDLFDTTLTETGFQPFTWSFGSPEQYMAQKDQISIRTDFFSIGVLGYFLFYGKLPFGDKKAEIHEKFAKRIDGFHLDNDNPLNNFFTDSMKISPSERPRNITDFNSLIV